jgi:hypothetical protein
MEAVLEDAIGDVVYGVAATGNSFYVWTRNELICTEQNCEGQHRRRTSVWKTESAASVQHTSDRVAQLASTSFSTQT